MIRFRNILPLVAAALVGVASQARADFQLRVSTDGGSNFSTYYSTDGGNSWYTGPGNTGTNEGNSVHADNLTIKATATDFLSTPLSTMNLTVDGTQANQQYNLLVQSSVTSVPTIPAPQTLKWTFNDSSSSLAGLTETARGWVDQSNTIFGTTTIVADTGTLTAPATGSTPFTAVPGYSWTEQFKLVGQGNTGEQLSAGNSESIRGAPAPAGLLLTLTGVPVLGLAAWIRRRRISTVA